MKNDDFLELKKGVVVVHRHYGYCKVTGKIDDFGILIRPLSKTGKSILYAHSNSKTGELLETSCRLILGYKNEKTKTTNQK